MGNIVSTVHLNLWISSFYSRDYDGQLQAKQLTSSLYGSSMGIALLCSMYTGYLGDKVKLNVLIPTVFGIGAIGVFLFTLINEPTSGLTYIAVICLNIGNMCQNIALYTLLYKGVSQGTRATLIGMYNVAGTIGNFTSADFM